MQPDRKPEPEDSDSEDDPDYVPPAKDASSSDDDEPAQKRPRTASPPPEEDEAEKKKARDALWAQFQASLAAPPPKPVSQPKLVKIVKRYRYAGDEITEVKEVPEDSEDAKKYPRWQPEPSKLSDAPAASTSTSTPATTSPEPSSTPDQTTSTPAESSTAGASASAQKPKPAKKPGPRKPKVNLAPLPGSQKAKKLTTLDKSAMDWRSHVEAEQSSDLKDELEANRRGGGYLEKVEFLKRVEERKEEALEASKSGKRRR
ncbi:hypothetical protein K474DRAFT_1693431 [Panus rudis PR-1116 ss-1]|nr:hypothetical protein K474DRAFT_1693431 [Panus rudis PR-1116 ss-1]